MPKDSDSKKIDYMQDKLDSIADTCSKIDKEVALQKAAFDDHLKQDERMYEEFKRMYEEFKRMNDILQQNTESLKEHMHRSDLLETLVQKMDDRFSPLEIEYLQKQAVRNYLMDKAKWIAKVGAALTALTAIWVFVEPIIKNLLQ